LFVGNPFVRKRTMFKYLILGLMTISLFPLSGCDREGGSENAALERELVTEYNDLEGEQEDLQSDLHWARDEELRRKVLRNLRRQVNVLKKLCDINPEAEVGITYPGPAKTSLKSKAVYVKSLSEIKGF
jgi:hypothetical protein